SILARRKIHQFETVTTIGVCLCFSQEFWAKEKTNGASGFGCTLRICKPALPKHRSIVRSLQRRGSQSSLRRRNWNNRRQGWGDGWIDRTRGGCRKEEKPANQG